MALPEAVSREEWLRARLRLLKMEKEETRRHAALAAERRRLPMMRVEKRYTLEGPRGRVGLASLFGDCGQLIVKHVMFAADWNEACPGCTADVDGIGHRVLTQLRSRDTAFALVSIAPLAKLEAYRAARGWTIPWYSSHGTDFNYDFQVTLDKSTGQVYYNYESVDSRLKNGEPEEESGFSCFLRDGDEIFHTYSTYARGTELLSPTYALLDLTPFGRSEDWEEPKGRARRLHAANPTFTD